MLPESPPPGVEAPTRRAPARPLVVLVALLFGGYGTAFTTAGPSRVEDPPDFRLAARSTRRETLPAHPRLDAPGCVPSPWAFVAGTELPKADGTARARLPLRRCGRDTYLRINVLRI